MLAAAKPWFRARVGRYASTGSSESVSTVQWAAVTAKLGETKVTPQPAPTRRPSASNSGAPSSVRRASKLPVASAAASRLRASAPLSSLSLVASTNTRSAPESSTFALECPRSEGPSGDREHAETRTIALAERPASRPWLGRIPAHALLPWLILVRRRPARRVQRDAAGWRPG